MTRVQLSDPEGEFIEPYLPIGEYGLYLEHLRQQFEGVIWHFRTGSQWRETPGKFGAGSTLHNRFRQWRDAKVFEALLEGAIAEAAKRGEVDLYLVGVDSTPSSRRITTLLGCTWIPRCALAALEKAVEEADRSRQKGVARKNRAGATRNGKIGGVSDAAAGSAAAGSA